MEHFNQPESAAAYDFGSLHFYDGRITPDKNVVFVFGSNTQGRHGKGAAKVAVTSFGAMYGQSEGLQGFAYAIPTKDLTVETNHALRSISRIQIVDSIKKMYQCAREHGDKTFKIAYTNAPNEYTLNGYNGSEMAQMFIAAAFPGHIPNNIEFSSAWKDEINRIITEGLPEMRKLYWEKNELYNSPICFSEVFTELDRCPYNAKDFEDLFPDCSSVIPSRIIREQRGDSIRETKYYGSFIYDQFSSSEIALNHVYAEVYDNGNLIERKYMSANSYGDFPDGEWLKYKNGKPYKFCESALLRFSDEYLTSNEIGFLPNGYIDPAFSAESYINGKNGFGSDFTIPIPDILRKVAQVKQAKKTGTQVIDIIKQKNEGPKKR